MNLGEFEDSETLAQDPAHNMPHHVSVGTPRSTPPERRELDGIGGGGNGRAVAKRSRPQNDDSSLSTSASPAQPASYSPGISRYLKEHTREQLDAKDRSDLTNSATPQTPRNRPLSMSERSRMKLCYSPTAPEAPTTPKATRLRLPSSLVHDPTFHVGRRVCYALRGDMLSPIAELNLKRLGQYFCFLK